MKRVLDEWESPVIGELLADSIPLTFEEDVIPVVQTLKAFNQQIAQSVDETIRLQGYVRLFMDAMLMNNSIMKS